MTDEKRVRLIAFYLPQFHPIPENDAWWGRGFTEWTNVVTARPLFRGHHQPHLPADLGFYDLRLPEAREAQADLARAHGIHGFCYHHYWFSGRRILERPLDDVLRSKTPDFPFCISWANENWTRRWDGRDEDVLLAQQYSHEDDRLHVRSLAPLLQDPRYIRVRGRPLVMIYRASRIPDPRRSVEVWREEARRLGFGDLYLCNVESFAADHGLAPKAGFDAAVEFAPDWTRLPSPIRHGPFWRLAAAAGLSNRNYSRSLVCDYRRLAGNMLAKPDPGYVRFPCVTPSWDNTARRRRGAVILADSSPEAYARWLREVLARFTPPGDEEDFVFVNAWNEWAEGCHLEPCTRWGRAYLEATRDALAARTSATEGSSPRIGGRA